MNRFGINLWNWRPGMDEGCLGLPAKAKELGFTAIELPMTVTALPDGLEREIRDSGLGVTLCAALGAGRDLSHIDPAVREATMQYFTQCLASGAAVGATVLAGPLYAGGGKRHWLSEADKQREWELAVTGLREVARRAAEYGIALSIEPINRYRTSVVNTAAQAMAMVEEIGAPNVGVHFDTYHACLEERDLLAALEACLRAGRVNHFHACANNRGAPGQGVVPWPQVFGLLRQYGYKGDITMETFALGGLDSSWVQVHDAPDELARAGITYMKNWFEQG